jgi:hypothetical protein
MARIAGYADCNFASSVSEKGRTPLSAANILNHINADIRNSGYSGWQNMLVQYSYEEKTT